MREKVKASYQFLSLKDIKAKGWLQDYLSAEVNGFSGHLDELCEEASSDIFGKNKITQIKPKDWWNGETEGNWMDGFTRLAFLAGDQCSIEKTEKYIQNVLNFQDEDGYIGVYAKEYRFENGKRNGEFWCLSRIFLIMLAYYEYTGKEDVLKAVKRAASLTRKHYGVEADGKPYFTDAAGGTGHGLMLVEALIWLYEITGDEEYLSFADFCYQDYSNCKTSWIVSDNKLKELADPQKPFIGHGVHTCEHLRIPLLLYYYTGKTEYHKAYQNGMDKILRTLGVSGICKSDEYIGRPDVAGLPLPTVGYEYCAITELQLSLQTAIQLTGKAKYADMAEKLLFNAGQAARKPDGKAIMYLSSDNLYEASKKIEHSQGIGKWDYSPTHDDAAICCVPNAARMMPYHISRMWMALTDTNNKIDGLAAVFYGPCTVATEVNKIPVTIEEMTQYPFDETVHFLIHIPQSTSFRLEFRIPDWSKKNTLYINGKMVDVNGEEGWCILEKEWSDGDEVILAFSAGVEFIEAVDGTVAVKRGPLIYALDIPTKEIITKEYAREGFYDYDYFAAEDSKWDYTLQYRKNDCLDKIFRVRKMGLQEGVSPWEIPPVVLETTVLDNDSQPVQVTLIPMGCTMLRRTTFSKVFVDTLITCENYSSDGRHVINILVE